jgi:hypothetical protein
VAELQLSHPLWSIRISPDARYRSAAGAGIIGVLDFTTVPKMDLHTFRDSVAKPQPPVGSSSALQALWWDAKGNWEKAHERVQEHDATADMRVHAYLHRKKGDQSNAEYWYRRCGVAPSILTLDEEWEELAQELLEQG